MNSYEEELITSLLDDDAISSEEAAFMEGYLDSF